MLPGCRARSRLSVALETPVPTVSVLDDPSGIVLDFLEKTRRRHSCPKTTVRRGPRAREGAPLAGPPAASLVKATRIEGARPLDAKPSIPPTPSAA